jgi:hypothetical protein
MRRFPQHDLTESDVPDLVDWHLDRREKEHRDRVVDVLDALVRG